LRTLSCRYPNCKFDAEASDLIGLVIKDITVGQGTVPIDVARAGEAGRAHSRDAHSQLSGVEENIGWKRRLYAFKNCAGAPIAVTVTNAPVKLVAPRVPLPVAVKI
jgi:hypothetical protein